MLHVALNITTKTWTFNDHIAVWESSVLKFKRLYMGLMAKKIVAKEVI